MRKNINKRMNPMIRTLTTLLVLLLILEGAYSAIKLVAMGGLSYSTGYQGARATFAGVEYNGEQWKTGDTTLLWDADDRGKDKPGIAGEQTAVFVPRESVSDQPTNLGGYDIKDWLLASTRIQNPIKSYEWDLPTSDGKTAYYTMEEWQLKWYFSIACEPTGDEILICWPYQNKRNYLSDVKVWFKFDLTPVWYFEGQTTSYFAIAELRLSDIAIGMKTGKKGYDTTYSNEANKEIRVTPMSKGSLLPIYYGLFGSEANRADKKAYDYQDKKLNPDLFTDTVYSYFTLNDFGVCSAYDWGTIYKGDVVTVGVDVHVFVVGEWDVKDEQELSQITQDYGRTAAIGGSTNPFGWLFNDPYGRMVLLAIGAVGVFLILAIFAPWIFILLFTVLGNFKLRKSKRG